MNKELFCATLDQFRGKPLIHEAPEHAPLGEASLQGLRHCRVPDLDQQTSPQRRTGGRLSQRLLRVDLSPPQGVGDVTAVVDGS